MIHMIWWVFPHTHTHTLTRQSVVPALQCSGLFYFIPTAVCQTFLKTNKHCLSWLNCTHVSSFSSTDSDYCSLHVHFFFPKEAQSSPFSIPFSICLLFFCLFCSTHNTSCRSISSDNRLPSCLWVSFLPLSSALFQWLSLIYLTALSWTRKQGNIRAPRTSCSSMFSFLSFFFA